MMRKVEFRRHETFPYDARRGVRADVLAQARGGYCLGGDPGSAQPA